MDYRSNRKKIPKDSGTVEWLVSDLPAALIMNILSRLSMKTLFKCRCVCKTWLHLMSDPFFIKLQFSRSATSILIQGGENSRKIKLLQVLEDDSIDGFQVEKMNFFPKINLPNSDFEVVNSCNGLLCLCKYHDCVYVCNPILGEYITIPVVNNKDKRKNINFFFGFSSFSGQYKVLQIFCRDEENELDTDSKHPEAEIYTIGTGKWRKIGNAPSSFDSNAYLNTFLRGSIHCVDYDSRTFDSIDAFDFDTEQFKQLPLCPHPPILYHGYLSLGVLQGCLSVAFTISNDFGNLEIWFMMEYGVKESWTKQFVIEHGNLHLSNYRFYDPLIFLSTRKILMLHCDESVVCYDPEERESLWDVVMSQPTKNGIKAIVHKPCFVSLQDAAKGEVKILRTRPEVKTNVNGIPPVDPTTSTLATVVVERWQTSLVRGEGTGSIPNVSRVKQATTSNPSAAVHASPQVPGVSALQEAVPNVDEGMRVDFHGFHVLECYVGLLGQLYDVDGVFWGTSCVEPLIMAAFLDVLGRALSIACVPDRVRSQDELEFVERTLVTLQRFGFRSAQLYSTLGKVRKLLGSFEKLQVIEDLRRRLEEAERSSHSDLVELSPIGNLVF